MESHIQPVSAGAIGQLDEGRFGQAVDNVVHRVWRDILDRPSNLAGKTEVRKIVITLEVEPQVIPTETGYDLDDVHLTPKVKGLLPEIVGNAIQVRGQIVRDANGNMVMGSNGQPLQYPHFNQTCSHKFDQKPLPFKDEEEDVIPINGEADDEDGGEDFGAEVESD